MTTSRFPEASIAAPRRPRRRTALANVVWGTLGALALAAPVAAAGNDRDADLTTLSLEQLMNQQVITASKFPQPVSEAPSAVIVVSSEDIRNYGYRTLADVLRSMRGVYVTYDRNYSYVGTRGSGRPGDYNSRILLLVDGRRLNDAVYNQASVGTEFPIDVELIDRVEFVPGPGSAIYGSSAFFGVVNVITKTGKQINGSELQVGAASYGTTNGRFSTGRRLENGADLLVSISGLNSRGRDRYFPEFDSPDSNNGVAVNADGDRVKQFFAKLNQGGVTLEAFGGRRIKEIPTASFGQQFNNGRSSTTDEYFHAAASLDRNLSPTTNLFGSLHYGQYIYSGDYLFAPSPSPINREKSASKTVTGELRLLNTSLRDHKIVAGLEIARNVERRLQNFDVSPFVPYLNSNHPTCLLCHKALMTRTDMREEVVRWRWATEA